MGTLDGTFGVLLIGFTVSAVLFGITNLQTYIYFQHYPRDLIWNKLSVIWLWILDALHLAFCMHMVYYYLITQYMNPGSLERIVWSFKAQMLINAIVVVSVQNLYAFRVWRLNKLTALESTRPLLWKIVPWIVSFVVLLGLSAAIVFCYEVTRFDLFTVLIGTPWVTDFSLGTAAAVDFVISCAMCYLLSRCRTGFSTVDSTVTVLMLYIINTGMITVVLTVTSIIIFSALPNTFGVVFIEFLITKLYVNSFMAMFNARARLRTPEVVYFAPANRLARGAASSDFSSGGPPRGDTKTPPRPRPSSAPTYTDRPISLASISPTFQDNSRRPISQVDADLESSLSSTAAEKRVSAELLDLSQR